MKAKKDTTETATAEPKKERKPRGPKNYLRSAIRDVRSLIEQVDVGVAPADVRERAQAVLDGVSLVLEGIKKDLALPLEQQPPVYQALIGFADAEPPVEPAVLDLFGEDV